MKDFISLYTAVFTLGIAIRLLMHEDATITWLNFISVLIAVLAWKGIVKVVNEIRKDLAA